ncbi:MAG: NUDIX domain-containing protein [Pseudomonadales bacterium]|nr:NUDIX domain-containing protein [Pseudomonadales bacterium]NRA17969.1 NUDIX domain-containing protein [Oceanospirillaceae bacterium]
MSVKISQIIFMDKNLVVLGFRQNVSADNNLWGFPAGRLEQGENPLEAAVRESMEEVGVEPIDIKGSFEILDQQGNQHSFFVCTHWRGVLHNGEADKCREIRWFAWDALPDDCTAATYIAREHLIQKAAELELQAQINIF